MLKTVQAEVTKGQKKKTQISMAYMNNVKQFIYVYIYIWGCTESDTTDVT